MCSYIGIIRFKKLFCLEFEMVPMEEGMINNKENYTEKVLLPDQSLEKNNFSTLTDSKNVCQNIMPHSIKDIALRRPVATLLCFSLVMSVIHCWKA